MLEFLDSLVSIFKLYNNHLKYVRASILKSSCSIYTIYSHNLIKDNKYRANEFVSGKRQIIPKAYSIKKMKAAHSSKREADNMDESDSDDDERTPLTKIIQQMECARKMKAMDNLTFDLTDADIDDIQNVLDESSSDEDEINENNQNSPDNILIPAEHDTIDGEIV